MSREDLHFRLRIPEHLKAMIKDAAYSNGRSMTAEIVARLSGISEDLRDRFAMAAMTGILAHPFTDGSDFLHDKGPIAVAGWSYLMADAMLAARKAGAA